MRKILVLALALSAIYSCQRNNEKDKGKISETAQPINFPEKIKNMTIYEVNIRQYTPEGTISAFIPHINRLKAMGIQTLWLMPVQPIGKKERKGSLGSYYSIKNYTAVNSEFGSLKDFKKLVSVAHANGMAVILDWVANHTAFDHEWIARYPEYYTQDSLGNIIPPVADWSDVADLNYENEDMRAKMTNAMRFWLTETDIDGFRCDMAGMVPLDFWEKAISSLREEKQILMLAEWESPEIHQAGFDMSYAWELHHLTNDIAKGEKNANDLAAYLVKEDSLYKPEDFKLYFTTNHDENSWNGTVFTRLDSAYRAISVLNFTLTGTPLIYSGQEAGLNKSLAFFEKDTISWDQLPYENWFSDLINLKANNPELWSAHYGGDFERISSTNPDNIFAFSRQQEENELIIMTNLSEETQSFVLDSAYGHTYKDLLSNEEIVFDQNNITFAPWQYHVLQKINL